MIVSRLVQMPDGEIAIAVGRFLFTHNAMIPPADPTPEEDAAVWLFARMFFLRPSRRRRRRGTPKSSD